MAVPKRKTSRMQRRQRKAANRYEGVAATYCTGCGAPVMPHRVCRMLSSAPRRYRARLLYSVLPIWQSAPPIQLM